MYINKSLVPVQLKFTFLIPVYNEAANIDHLADEFGALWEQYAYEIVFVDDGSADDTIQRLVKLSDSLERVKIVCLSRNYGKEQALAAGFSVVAPAVPVLAMDGDGQHTASAAMALIQRFMDDDAPDVVYGVRADRNYQGIVQRWVTRGMYKYINAGASRYKIDESVGDFFVASCKVVDVFKSFSGHRLFWKGYYGYVGFHAVKKKIKVSERHAGRSAFNFRSQLQLALDGTVSNSKLPLRAIFIFGLFAFTISMGYAAWLLLNYLMNGQTANGFYTLAVIQLWFGGVMMMSMGILAEYIGLVVDQVSNKPGYIIRDVIEPPA